MAVVSFIDYLDLYRFYRFILASSSLEFVQEMTIDFMQIVRFLANGLKISRVSSLSDYG